MLESRNTEIANALRSLCDSFLLETGEIGVAFLPGGIDLITRGRRRVGEGENCSDGSGIERRVQFVRRPHQHLESDFLLASLHLADDGDGRGRRLRFRGPRRYSDRDQFPALVW